MKVAYLLESTNAREILENMIVPQLEKGIHSADVVGMMFFFGVLGFLLARPLVSLSTTDPQVIDHGVRYLRLI